MNTQFYKFLSIYFYVGTRDFRHLISLNKSRDASYVSLMLMHLEIYMTLGGRSAFLPAEGNVDQGTMARRRLRVDAAATTVTAATECRRGQPSRRPDGDYGTVSPASGQGDGDLRGQGIHCVIGCRRQKKGIGFSRDRSSNGRVQLISNGREHCLLESPTSDRARLDPSTPR